MTERLMRSAAYIIIPCLFLAGGVYAQRNSSTSDGTRVFVDVSAPFGKNFSKSTHSGGILLIGSNVYEARFEKHRLVMKVPQPSVSTGGKAVTLGERLETSEGRVAYATHSGEVVCEGRTMFSAGEFIVDTTLGYGAAVGAQSRPAVAFDGANYLVVWQDDERGGDIYGSRVTPDGVVLDSAGIVISRAANRQIYPAVAFDGTNYLVVWQDYRSDPDGDVYGARVSRTGVVLDPAGIAISTAEYGQAQPAVAFDDTNYLVVWDDRRSQDYDIRGARIDPSGMVLDSMSLGISLASNGQNYPAVAFDGTNYLVVWQDYRSDPDGDVYGARVSRTGVVLDSSGIAIATAFYGQGEPAVGCEGLNFMVVWQDRRSGSSWDVYGARISSTGLVVDSLFVSQQPRDQVSSAFAADPSGKSLVVYAGWCDTINGHFARVARIWGKVVLHLGIEEDPRRPPYGLRTCETTLSACPSPARGRAVKIKYSLARTATVRLVIFNSLGQVEEVLAGGQRKAGIYERAPSKKLGSGVYFIHLDDGSMVLMRKIIIVD